MNHLSPVYSVCYSETLASSGCIPLAVIGWADLMKQGLIDEHSADVLNGRYKAIYVERLTFPVAVLAFTIHPEMATAWIRFVYVDSGNRRRGLYRSMLAELVERARAAGCVRIQGGVSGLNQDMITALVSTRQQVEYSVWTLEIGAGK
jgi:GNAT superfamily N-acetyltransferase